MAAEVKKLVEGPLTEARQIPGKNERNDKVGEIRKAMLDEHFKLNESGTYGEYDTSKKRRDDAREAFRRLEKKITRSLIVKQGKRADGRKPAEIRPLLMETGIFERTHGSALFQRGETQSIVTATLGTGKDEQIVDGLLPEYSRTSTRARPRGRGTTSSERCAARRASRGGGRRSGTQSGMGAISGSTSSTNR